MISAAIKQASYSILDYAAGCGVVTISLLDDALSPASNCPPINRSIKKILSGGAGLLAGAAARATTDRLFEEYPSITPDEKQMNSTISAYLASATTTAVTLLFLDMLFPNNTASGADNHQSASLPNQDPTQ